MELRLTYPDSQNQQPREIIADTPIAIGCNITYMPKRVDSQAVFQIVIFDPTTKPFHALITEHNGRLKVMDHRDRVIDLDQNSLTLGQVAISLAGDFLPPLATSNITPNHQADVQESSDESDRCQKMVGFLFKRICDRTTTIGCPHCKQAGQDWEQDSEIYALDYSYYQDYGSYDSYDTWGNSYYRDRHYYHYDHHHRRVNFTEADNRAFETEGDRDFEQDYSAS